MPEINLYQLRIFYSVARHLSYSRAGEELALSQPAVSRQVAALEDGLGLELFVRKGRQIALTDAGRILYDYADRIFDLARQAERAMMQCRDLERGIVRVGACTTIGTYFLPPVLQAFQERYPQIDTVLFLGNSTAIEQMVVKGDVDLGFSGINPESPMLHLEPCCEEKLVLILSPQHPLQERRDLLLTDLLCETLFWREAGSAGRKAVEDYLAQKNVRFKKTVEIRDNETIKRLVAAGMGVAFIPRRAVALEVTAGILRVMEGDEFCIPQDHFILAAKDYRPCPVVLTFIQFIRKYAQSSGERQ